jgi:hypothetical protein
MCAEGTAQDYYDSFDADGERVDVMARSSEALSEICDVVLRLLTASVVRSVSLNRYILVPDGLLIHAPTLAYLMEQCQSLEDLTLEETALDEDHCRVLGALSRPDLEIELIECHITGAGASALAEVLGRNQGPTKLGHCNIDNIILANGLRGNSRLKSLSLRLPSILLWGSRELL